MTGRHVSYIRNIATDQDVFDKAHRYDRCPHQGASKRLQEYSRHQFDGPTHLRDVHGVHSTRRATPRVLMYAVTVVQYNKYQFRVHTKHFA